ncbi:unnamed protein product, partial [Adineta ricciae]
ITAPKKTTSGDMPSTEHLQPEYVLESRTPADVTTALPSTSSTAQVQEQPESAAEALPVPQQHNLLPLTAMPAETQTTSQPSVPEAIVQSVLAAAFQHADATEVEELLENIAAIPTSATPPPPSNTTQFMHTSHEHTVEPTPLIETVTTILQSTEPALPTSLNSTEQQLTDASISATPPINLAQAEALQH